MSAAAFTQINIANLGGARLILKIFKRHRNRDDKWQTCNGDILYQSASEALHRDFSSLLSQYRREHFSDCHFFFFFFSFQLLVWNVFVAAEKVKRFFFFPVETEWAQVKFSHMLHTSELSLQHHSFTLTWMHLFIGRKQNKKDERIRQFSEKTNVWS